MNRKTRWVVIYALLLVGASACSKNPPTAKVIVEIPAGFTGNFLLEMGVKDAPPPETRGDAYVVTVPRSGKLITSTLLIQPEPTFQNSSDGGVWGYSHSVFITGDRIPTGGKIEFLVGTRKDFEAEQGRKHHSEWLWPQPTPSGV